MANINDWRDALYFLYKELVSELSHSGVTEGEAYRIRNAVISAFEATNQEIGKIPFED